MAAKEQHLRCHVFLHHREVCLWRRRSGRLRSSCWTEADPPPRPKGHQNNNQQQIRASSFSLFWNCSQWSLNDDYGELSVFYLGLSFCSCKLVQSNPAPSSLYYSPSHLPPNLTSETKVASRHQLGRGNPVVCWGVIRMEQSRVCVLPAYFLPHKHDPFQTAFVGTV